VLEVFSCNGGAGGDVRLQLLCLGHIQSLPEIEASENGFLDHISFEGKSTTAARTKQTQQWLFNTLNAELNPICYLLALLGAHHFLHVSRIRVKL